MIKLKYAGYSALFLMAIPLSYNALTYINFDGNYGFLRLKQDAIASGWYLPGYYAHVLVAAVILVIGIFQIHPRWGLKWRRIHRIFGKVYVFGILFFSAPGALVMSMFIGRGPWVLTSFVMQCVLWFSFTSLAWYFIMRGNVQAHRHWMLRSFSLTLAAITLRAYVFFSSWSYDLSQPAAYATIAWLSWLPNLLICEFYLHISNSRSIEMTG